MISKTRLGLGVDYFQTNPYERSGWFQVFNPLPDTEKKTARPPTGTWRCISAVTVVTGELWIGSFDGLIF